MLNEFGYDYFQYADSLNYDDEFYTEMMKPVNRKENFNNEINDILDEINCNEMNNSNNNDSMQRYMYKQRSTMNQLNNNCEYYKFLLRKKYKEVIEKNNQIFIFYILLFISIIIIIYQKISLMNIASGLENINRLLYLMSNSQKNDGK